VQTPGKQATKGVEMENQDINRDLLRMVVSAAACIFAMIIAG